MQNGSGGSYYSKLNVKGATEQMLRTVKLKSLIQQEKKANPSAAALQLSIQSVYT